MKALILVAAACVAAVSVPALADPATVSATTAIAAAPVAAIDPARDDRRVCAVYPVTGSLIMRRTCRTRAEWIALGVDPLARR